LKQTRESLARELDSESRVLAKLRLDRSAAETQTVNPAGEESAGKTTALVQNASTSTASPGASAPTAAAHTDSVAPRSGVPATNSDPQPATNRRGEGNDPWEQILLDLGQTRSAIDEALNGTDTVRNQ